MNDYDIEDVLELTEGDPVLHAAARTLANLRDCANANSDGWMCWPKPRRSAARLIALLEGVRRNRYSGEEKKVTRGEVRKAYTPIRSFLTRHNLVCEIEEV